MSNKPVKSVWLAMNDEDAYKRETLLPDEYWKDHEKKLKEREQKIEQAPVPIPSEKKIK